MEQVFFYGFAVVIVSSVIFVLGYQVTSRTSSIEVDCDEGSCSKGT